jgi:hypothetical protein
MSLLQRFSRCSINAMLCRSAAARWPGTAYGARMARMARYFDAQKRQIERDLARCAKVMSRSVAGA